MKNKRYNKITFDPSQLIGELKTLDHKNSFYYLKLIFNVWENTTSQFSFYDISENWKKLLNLESDDFLEIRKNILANKFTSIQNVVKENNGHALCEILFLKNIIEKKRKKSLTYSNNSNMRFKKKVYVKRKLNKISKEKDDIELSKLELLSSCLPVLYVKNITKLCPDMTIDYIREKITIAANIIKQKRSKFLYEALLNNLSADDFSMSDKLLKKAKERPLTKNEFKAIPSKYHDSFSIEKIIIPSQRGYTFTGSNSQYGSTKILIDNNSEITLKNGLFISENDFNKIKDPFIVRLFNPEIKKEHTKTMYKLEKNIF